MSEVVSYRLEGDIGVIGVDYPPVNALGQGVREGLVNCLRQGLEDDQAKALVVIGEGDEIVFDNGGENLLRADLGTLREGWKATLDGGAP